MSRAKRATLAQLSSFLDDVRRLGIADLVEKANGAFYVRRVGILHFHEDGDGVYADGRKVVDLRGGWADAQRRREWQHDTIACTYSATKGMTATCAHHLVDRGLLDVDEPVATYWPEFAQAGKDKVTVRMLLNHQAGRPRPRARASGRVMGDSDVPAGKRFDWETMTSAMAAGTPMWYSDRVPGSHRVASRVSSQLGAPSRVERSG